MQYTFSMTPRMISLALVCLLLLFVLLFLAGVEIGQMLAGQTVEVAVPDLSKSLPTPPKLPVAPKLIAPLLPTTP